MFLLFFFLTNFILNLSSNSQLRAERSWNEYSLKSEPKMRLAKPLNQNLGTKLDASKRIKARLLFINQEDFMSSALHSTAVQESLMLGNTTADKYAIPENFGAFADGVHNDTDAIRKTIKYCLDNNKILLLSGKYFIDESLDIDKDSLVIKGQKNNLILGPIFWGFKISASNIQISNVNIKSTVVADYSKQSENGAPQGIANGGLIYVLPPNGKTLSNIRIDGCSFSSPNGSVNAIKLIAFRSGTGGFLTDVFIDQCLFNDIGRMGVEVLGGSGNTFYYNNINVRDCKFIRMGLKSIYGMAVSFSGSGAYNTVNNCYIEGAKDLGLENAGASYTKFINNTFSSFNPNSTILSIQSNDDHIVKFGNSAINNKILDSSAFKLADIYFQSDMLFSQNDFSSTNMGIVIQATQKSSFLNNKLHCNGLSSIIGYGSTIYFRESASLDNVFDSNSISNKSTKFDVVYISETSGNNKFNKNKLFFINQTSKMLICDKNKSNSIK